MKKTILVIVIISFIVSFFSCKKKCDSIDELPHEFLDYWYFNQGSWWVFQLKDSTNIYDTVTVSKDELFTNGVNNDGGYLSCTEYITYFFRHSNPIFSNYIYVGYYDQYYSRVNGNRKNYYLDFSNLKTNSSVSFLYYDKDKGFTCDYGTCYDIQSVQTPQDTFNETLHYKLNDSTQFYFAKNIGLVKRITIDKKTWELINYNVIQNY
jgi:hypothetical protein